MVFFQVLKSNDLRSYVLPAAVAVVGLGAVWWYKKRKARRYYRPVGVVSGLNVYPIKSCKGITLQEASCLQMGIKYDR